MPHTMAKRQSISQIKHTYTHVAATLWRVYFEAINVCVFVWVYCVSTFKWRQLNGSLPHNISMQIAKLKLSFTFTASWLDVACFCCECLFWAWPKSIYTYLTRLNKSYALMLPFVRFDLTVWNGYYSDQKRLQLELAK